MWQLHKTAGFTLAETVVASLLMALCSLVLTNLLVFTLRSQAFYAQRLHLVVSGQRALSRMHALIGETRASLIARKPKFIGIVFPLAKAGKARSLQFNPQGELEWQDWHALGFDSKKETLFEAANPMSEPSTTPEPLFHQFGLNPANWTRVVILRGVTDMAISDAGSNIQKIRLNLRALDASGYRIELQTQVVAAN